MKKIFFIISLALLPLCTSAIGVYSQINITMNRKVDSSYWIGPKNGPFWMISKNGYFGLADQNYLLIAEAKYDRIFGYSEGMVVVCESNLYGALDSTGKEIITPTLQFLADFQNGLAYGKNISGDDVLMNKYGLNIVPGKNIRILALKGNYLQIDEGVCCLLNREGKTIYNVNTWEFGAKEASFWRERNCSWFTDPITVLSSIQEANSTKTFYRLPELSTNFPFTVSEGLILVPKLIHNEIKLGYIDEWGKEIIPFLFEDARSFVNGFTCAKQNNLWGVIDTKGNWVIQPQYQNLENVNGYYFTYTHNDLQGVINIHNDTVIKAKFLQVKYLNGDLFAMLESNVYSERFKNRFKDWNTTILDFETGSNIISYWGCVNAKNIDTILPFKFSEILPINEKIAIAVKYEYGHTSDGYHSSVVESILLSSKAVVFSELGVQIKFPKEETSDKLIFVGKDMRHSVKPSELYKYIDKYLYIGGSLLDDNGNEILNQITKDSLIKTEIFIPSIITQYKSIIKNGDSIPGNVAQYGVNTFTGQTILPIEFEKIIIAKTAIIARQDGKYGVYDFSGKLIIPHVYTRIDELRTGVFSVSKDENGSQRFFVNRNNKEINIKF